MAIKKDLKKTEEASRSEPESRASWSGSVTPSLVVVWTTVATSEQATKIAAGLLDGRLAACVQVDPPITSHYVWEGRRCAETELRVVIKTTAARSQSVFDWLIKNHPYDEPQILAIPVERASPGYARWVAESVAQASD